MANMTFVEQIQNVNTNSWNEFLLSSFFNNSMQDYMMVLIIFFAILFGLKIFKMYIILILKKFAKRTKTHVDDILLEVLNAIKWPFYVLFSLIFSLKTLELPIIFNEFSNKLLMIILVYYSILTFCRILDYFAKKEIKKRMKEDRLGDTAIIRLLATLGKVALWIIGLLLMLANFGVEITPLIAGLGVGGIAIAFALQKILEDLFSSFAIYFDKPFKEGDFIVVGTDKGVVQHIGLKTTRIKALQGEELIVSNTELTNARISNYKGMENRRIAFRFGVEYSTSTIKLKKAVKIVEKIINDIKDINLDRVHFFEFGDFSLNFEVVYYVNFSDYAIYMGMQQEVNFAIKQAFEKEKIEMAFPTQTIILQK